MFEPAENDLLPPPSYELSQEEFDRKTSQAVQASLAANSTANEEDEWEVWDEGAFEAAARAASSSGASSSSSPPAAPPPRPEKAPMIEEPMVQPLKIVKRSKPSPHMYSKSDDANGHRHPPYFGTSSHSPPPSNSPVESFRHSRSLSIMSLRRTPPPSFEAEAPSLAGPPYGEVILQYQPGDSRPSSPLANYSVPAPRPSRSHQPQSYGPASHTNSHSPSPNQRRSFPNVPQRAPQRQPNQYPPLTRGIPLSTNFNPLSAYSKSSPLQTESEGMPTKVDAAAFYTSAVSAHLQSKSPQRPVATPNRQNSMYPQDFPIMAQSQTYNPLYNDAYYPGNHRSGLPSTPSELNHPAVSQPYYPQQPLPPNHPDTRWHNYQQPLQPSH